MWKHILSPFAFSALAACYVVRPEAQPAGIFVAQSIPIATASIYTYQIPYAPIPTQVNEAHEDLVRREAPAPANPVNPVVDPNFAPLSSAPQGGGVGGISVTVQWVETWIGKPPTTTWVPITVTLSFADVPNQAPLPGKGEVGMGTLTGLTGQMRTVAAAAVPTRGVELMKRVVVAAGVGLAGMMV